MIRKTATITAASIAGVVLAGSAAVGANIGILDAADDTGLGTLSAESGVASPAQTGATTVPPATSAVTVPPAIDESGQTFAVDVAGSVELETDDSGLHVTAVQTADGWSWTEAAGDPDIVALTFTSGEDTLEFVAALNADGSIDARVDRPVLVYESSSVTATGGSSAPAAGYVDDDDHEEHEEHDEYEDDEYEDDEHDDHDDHEHEGRDDDD